MAAIHEWRQQRRPEDQLLRLEDTDRDAVEQIGGLSMIGVGVTLASAGPVARSKSHPWDYVAGVGILAACDAAM